MQVIEEKVLDSPRARSRIPLKRRLAYAAIIYLSFLLLLAAIELGTRLTLLAESLGNVGADRFGRPPDLIGQRPLLDPGELEAPPMHFRREALGHL